MRKFPFSCVLYALQWYYDAKIDLLSRPSPSLKRKDFEGGNYIGGWQEQKKAEMVTIGLSFRLLSYNEEDTVDRWFLMENNPTKGYDKSMFYSALEHALSKMGTDMMHRDKVLECSKKYPECKNYCVRDRSRLRYREYYKPQIISQIYSTG